MTHDDDPDLLPADEDLAHRLTAERPVPRAGFRGALGSHLSVHDEGYGPRPEALRVMVAALLALSGVLLVIGALISAGSL